MELGLNFQQLSLIGVSQVPEIVPYLCNQVRARILLSLQQLQLTVQINYLYQRCDLVHDTL